MLSWLWRWKAEIVLRQQIKLSRSQKRFNPFSLSRSSSIRKNNNGLVQWRPIIVRATGCKKSWDRFKKISSFLKNCKKTIGLKLARSKDCAMRVFFTFSTFFPYSALIHATATGTRFIPRNIYSPNLFRGIFLEDILHGVSHCSNANCSNDTVAYSSKLLHTSSLVERKS